MCLGVSRTVRPSTLSTKGTKEGPSGIVSNQLPSPMQAAKIEDCEQKPKRNNQTSKDCTSKRCLLHHREQVKMEYQIMEEGYYPSV